MRRSADADIIVVIDEIAFPDQPLGTNAVVEASLSGEQGSLGGRGSGKSAP